MHAEDISNYWNLDFNVSEVLFLLKGFKATVVNDANKLWLGSKSWNLGYQAFIKRQLPEVDFPCLLMVASHSPNEGTFTFCGVEDCLVQYFAMFKNAFTYFSFLSVWKKNLEKFKTSFPNFH